MSRIEPPYIGICRTSDAPKLRWLPSAVDKWQSEEGWPPAGPEFVRSLRHFALFSHKKSGKTNKTNGIDWGRKEGRKGLKPMQGRETLVRPLRSGIRWCKMDGRGNGICRIISQARGLPESESGARFLTSGQGDRHPAETKFDEPVGEIFAQNK